MPPPASRAASWRSTGATARRLQALARRSFALHASLASELGGDWGFRRLDTYGGFASARRGVGEDDEAPALPWLSKGVAINQRLGTGATTAQVHPGDFTKAMMRAAEARGAELRLGAVTGILRSEDGARVRGVEIDGEALSADAVVIAMGPWSIVASNWLPLPRIFGLKGHSLVFDTGDRGARRGAVPRIPGGERRDAHAGSLSAHRRHDLHLRDLLGEPGACRSCRCHAGSRRAGAAGEPRDEAVAGTPLGEDPRAAGLLPAGHAGRPAADRKSAGRRRRLRRDRPQRVGHPERAGDRRGDGRADRRGSGEDRRPFALRSGAASRCRSGARFAPDCDQTAGFRSPITVGISSETVGWMGTAHCSVV